MFRRAGVREHEPAVGHGLAGEQSVALGIDGLADPAIRITQRQLGPVRHEAARSLQPTAAIDIQRHSVHVDPSEGEIEARVERGESECRVLRGRVKGEPGLRAPPAATNATYSASWGEVGLRGVEEAGVVEAEFSSVA